MNTQVREYLQNLDLGEPSEYGGICVYPVFHESDELPHPYISCAEALREEKLKVTEVNKNGVVSTILAINLGELPILILAGEELIGAKQNRIVNSSVLLRPHSETMLPVNCTEQGRWHHASPEFQDSGSVALHSVRRSQSRNVTGSLKADGSYAGDQTETWHEVSSAIVGSRICSSTDAMQDIFQQRHNHIREMLMVLGGSHPGQVGLMVMCQGKVLGFDAVSRPDVYKQVHERLLKSYLAIDYRDPEAEPKSNQPHLGLIFLTEAAAQRGQKFRSVGMGWDHRIDSGNITGNALVVDHQPIHISLFQDETDEKETHEYQDMIIDEIHRCDDDG